MPEEFEGRDLSGAVFWGVDLTGATFRDVDMTGVTISHARVVDIDIDGLVERVTINGVDVTAHVNAGDRWYPLRAMLRPADPEGMRAAWRALEETWATTIERASGLTEEQLHESIDGEWSFVSTLRHLVFAMDKWVDVPILGDELFQPYGLPNAGSNDLDWPGRDRTADPTFAEVLAVRAERAARFRDHLETLTPSNLDQQVVVIENGTVPAIECYYTVFEEEFEHNRYATRDLGAFD